jgi:hypothetical protein
MVSRGGEKRKKEKGTNFEKEGYPFVLYSFREAEASYQTIELLEWDHMIFFCLYMNNS